MKRDQSPISTRQNKSLRSRFLIILLIFSLSASSGFVLAFPVYDAANHTAKFQVAAMQEKNRATEFMNTMNQWATNFKNWRTQYDHARQVWSQVDNMRGNWRGVITRLSDQEFVRAVLGDEGRDLVRLGWELRNGPRTNLEVLPDQALDALERIEKTMNNKRTPGTFLQNGDPTLREDLQEVFGQVPGNRPDIENAHRTLARATSTIANINKGIEERRKNIEAWKQRIAGGGLVPGDLERLQIMISAEEQDIQLLNSRLGALNIEVQMAYTGLLASGESNREVARARAESAAAAFPGGAGLINQR